MKRYEKLLNSAAAAAAAGALGTIALTGSTRATTSKRTSVTVAILAQGTSWAVAVTQAYFDPGSIPTACPWRQGGLNAALLDATMGATLAF